MLYNAYRWFWMETLSNEEKIRLLRLGNGSDIIREESAKYFQSWWDTLEYREQVENIARAMQCTGADEDLHELAVLFLGIRHKGCPKDPAESKRCYIDSLPCPLRYIHAELGYMLCDIVSQINRGKSSLHIDVYSSYKRLPGSFSGRR